MGGQRELWIVVVLIIAGQAGSFAIVRALDLTSPVLRLLAVVGGGAALTIVGLGIFIAIVYFIRQHRKSTE
jgi:hypothetical protein